MVGLINTLPIMLERYLADMSLGKDMCERHSKCEAMASNSHRDDAPAPPDVFDETERFLEASVDPGRSASNVQAISDGANFSHVVFSDIEALLGSNYDGRRANIEAISDGAKFSHAVFPDTEIVLGSTSDPGGNCANVEAISNGVKSSHATFSDTEGLLGSSYDPSSKPKNIEAISDGAKFSHVVFSDTEGLLGNNSDPGGRLTNVAISDGAIFPHVVISDTKGLSHCGSDPDEKSNVKVISDGSADPAVAFDAFNRFNEERGGNWSNSKDDDHMVTQNPQLSAAINNESADQAPVLQGTRVLGEDASWTKRGHSKVKAIGKCGRDRVAHAMVQNCSIEVANSGTSFLVRQQVVGMTMEVC